MGEIDTFQQSANQEQQSEYLKSINQSMSRLVDVNERQLNSSSNQFMQGNAVQSTVANLKDVTQGAYDRFYEDVGTARDFGRSTSNRAIDFGGTISGTARELGTHVPTIQPLAPVSATGFFGTSAGYSTNYKSTFWNDLWAGYGGERAPQSLFQSDFQQMGQENVHARLAVLSPLRAAANLLGINTALDEDTISSTMAMSQRYTRSGTSRAISGVGSTRGEVIRTIEHERGMLLGQIGYDYDEFQAAKQVFAAGGQFIGTKSELERSHVTEQGMEHATQIAKVLAVPIQEAARAMMDVRSQLGITSLSGQANFVQGTQALAMASGLSFQEAMGGALAGANLARGAGFNVRAGGTLGRDILASVNSAYLDRALGENLVQSAGGVQNLSSNLANSAISFATGPGSMYYLASMQGGQFNQQAFNQASGGFGQLGSMAASNASTIQGYANFIANSDNLQSQGGSFNAMAMQRSHMNNIFKSATGRNYDTSSTEDTNMMKMLASSSGMFTDPTTAKAFVEMNFTESGQESMYSSQRDAYRAEKNLKFKSSLDQRFKGNSTDALARSIQNIWNRPAQGVRAWFNDTFEDVGGRRKEEEAYLWSTGQMPLGALTSSDVQEFGKSGGFSNDISTFKTANAVIPLTDTGVGARTLVGGWEGAKQGFNTTSSLVGGTVMGVGIGSMIAGGLMAGVGGLMMATGIGALPGVALVAAGGSVAGWGAGTTAAGFLGGMTAGLVGAGVGAMAGGVYGAMTVPVGAGGYMTQEAMATNDKSVAAWNRGGGFSTAEKNTMGDPDFQKKIVKSLMDKGLGSTNKITAGNQDAVLSKIRQTAQELGIPEAMVANIAQTKAGVQGDPIYGADLAWAQTSGPVMSDSAIKDSLKESLGDKFGNLINDSGFTSKLGSLLAAGGDVAERRMAQAKFLGAYEKDLSEDTKEILNKYVATGAMENREGLASELGKRTRNLQSIKVKGSISELFGSRAGSEEFSDVADQFNEIANASSPSQQVGMVLGRMQSDEGFKAAIGRDPTLKRLLPLEGPIDRSMLSDAETFKKRFGSRPTDDLKELQKMFDKDGQEAVKARIAGGILATQAGGDSTTGKQNEAQILKDAAETFKNAAEIIKGMKR